MVCGYAGSGKSEFARFVSQMTGWPVLDKDLITQPVVERLLVALGSEHNDRHSTIYREQVRPLEYQCLLDTAHTNIESRVSAILSAPFISEVSDALWLQSLTERCQAHGVNLSVAWVQSDLDTMHEYIGFRSAARDTWKLEHWDEYAAGIDLELRPVMPHLLVDNRRGSTISRTDQVRRLFV
ncbi:MAG: AAA family ATPase [Streptomyces sp.]